MTQPVKELADEATSRRRPPTDRGDGAHVGADRKRARGGRRGLLDPLAGRVGVRPTNRTLRSMAL